jgi:hypothetical protein
MFVSILIGMPLQLDYKFIFWKFLSLCSCLSTLLLERSKLNAFNSWINNVGSLFFKLSLELIEEEQIIVWSSSSRCMFYNNLHSILFGIIKLVHLQCLILIAICFASTLRSFLHLHLVNTISSIYILMKIR